MHLPDILRYCRKSGSISVYRWYRWLDIISALFNAKFSQWSTAMVDTCFESRFRSVRSSVFEYGGSLGLSLRSYLYAHRSPGIEP
jgi:hypothetical protein